MSVDPAWIAKTLAEQALSSDAAPADTLGRVSITRDDPQATARELALSLPRLELVRGDDEPVLDPLSPHLYVRGQLGEGGVGIVELAHQPLLNRDVAVKRLLDPSPSRAALLLREARITGSLEHPNIIPIHTIGHHPELGPLVVMKRIQGESWEARLALDRARVRVDENALAAHVEILTRVCQAVEFAHSRGVLHRDLKPSNVMLGEFGELYLVDWGLALELGAPAKQQLVGSPAYMPPEMVLGERDGISPRSDVYLLGATLHEVLTGQHRHAGATVREVLARALESPPHRYGPEVPEELAAICNRACHRDPARRFPDVESLRQALQRYLEHRRATAALRAATRQHERLGALLRGAEPSSRSAEAELTATFQQVVIRYEQALEIWADLESAREGRRRAMLEMLAYELERANVHGAARILDALDDAPREQRERLERLIEARETTEARLSSLEEEVALRRAEPARLTLISGIIATVALMNLGLYLVNPTPRADTPPARLIVLAVVLCLIAALLIVPRWRRLTANLAGRQYVRFVGVVLTLILINRIRGYVLDDPGLSVMSSDLLLIGVGMCTIRLPLPGVVLVGIAVIGASVAMTLAPGVSRVIFLVTTSAVPLIMLAADRYNQGPAVADDGPPRAS
ncbi:MAG: protein kinase [Myxococcales bacterium]|nr:protein kinase [Myxococcales bacterium]